VFGDPEDIAVGPVLKRKQILPEVRIRKYQRYAQMAGRRGATANEKLQAHMQGAKGQR